jgi:hypothetical protein
MNQRLPALTARDVIRALERAGFVSRANPAAIADLSMRAIPHGR